MKIDRNIKKRQRSINSHHLRKALNRSVIRCHLPMVKVCLRILMIRMVILLLIFVVKQKDQPDK